MASSSDTPTTIYPDEPPRRAAPILSIGPLAWVRQNLFRTGFDTALTFVAGALVIAGLWSLLLWSVAEANWFVITRNLRLFMLGSFQAEFQWRVDAAALVTTLVVGFSVAAWVRLNRFVALLLLLTALLIVLAPPLTYGLTPPASAYLAAGATPVASGSVTELPQPRLAFIARAGETITISLPTALQHDGGLLAAAGFMDRAAAAAVNNARNRAEAAARAAALQTQLANPELLTANQRTLFQEQLAALQVPPPVAETYALNQQAVTLQVLRGTTLEVLAETTLAPGDPAWRLTLPHDGWYVLAKSVAAEAAGLSLLQTTGIYPIIVRDISVALQGGGSRTAAEYLRINDDLEIVDAIPEIDGVALPFANIIDNQYRGHRPLRDYLRLHVAPFLQWSGRLLLPLLLAGVLGYALARYLLPPRRTYWAARLWFALPLVAWLLIYGIGGPLPISDTRRWGGLLLTLVLSAVGIIASFPLGVLLALGRRSHLPVISLVCTLFIELVRGVPLITVLFMAQLLVPLINPNLAEVDNVFRAMVGITIFSAAYLAENVRGGLQSIPHGQEEAARALGLNNFQVTYFITLPQALRAVIPALVGQFISLFKDTSLVAIVGLIDLTGVSRAVLAQTEFSGLQTETAVFIAVIYLVFCYAMAYVSRRIEASGSGAARRV